MVVPPTSILWMSLVTPTTRLEERTSHPSIDQCIAPSASLKTDSSMGLIDRISFLDVLVSIHMIVTARCRWELLSTRLPATTPIAGRIDRSQWRGDVDPKEFQAGVNTWKWR